MYMYVQTANWIVLFVRCTSYNTHIRTHINQTTIHNFHWIIRLAFWRRNHFEIYSCFDLFLLILIYGRNNVCLLKNTGLMIETKLWTYFDVYYSSIRNNVYQTTMNVLWLLLYYNLNNGVYTRISYTNAC
jgi:hypothetical protein